MKTIVTKHGLTWECPETLAEILAHPDASPEAVAKILKSYFVTRMCQQSKYCKKKGIPLPSIFPTSNGAYRTPAQKAATVLKNLAPDTRKALLLQLQALDIAA